MFALRDFYHLPQLDPLFDQLADCSSGLILIAGLDSRPGLPSLGDAWLPSGRSAILSVLVDLILTRHEKARCIAVAESKEAVRIPRQFRRRMKHWLVEPPFTYPGRISAAVDERPGLLVIDRLDETTLEPALLAGESGVRVLAPLDSVFHGAGVIHHLRDLGASEQALEGLRWIVSVQRLKTLCAQCKQAGPPDERSLWRLQQRLVDNDVDPDLEQALTGLMANCFWGGGCARCGYSGRYGEVAVFDVFHNPPGSQMEEVLEQPSLLPLETYIAHLAHLGHLPLEEYLDFETGQQHRIGRAFLAREAMLAESAAAYERKLAEIEAANRVLQRRTRSLVSLHEIGQALVTSVDLSDLSGRVCRFVRDLCGADRVILYYLQDEEARVLAYSGWQADRVPDRVSLVTVFQTGEGPRLQTSREPVPFNRWPPGIAPRNPDVEGAQLLAGLYAPLVAEEKLVGFIIAHTTRRHSFAPADISLLSTISQQAALGIQRAHLIERLRSKIEQLEAAQDALRRKERLERELELARQVQQRMLPRTFPEISGFQFAARSEPARRVGGDFFDVFNLDEDRFGVAIADVADKGLPSALFMALSRSLLRAEAYRQHSPKMVLTSVNRLLLELGEQDMFVTLFYAVIDRRSHRLTYARAGHDRPLLARDGVIQPLSGDGTPVGILDQKAFFLDETSIDLAPGDRLVLYTDGLIDVANPAGDMYGYRAFIDLIRRYAQQPADQLCEAIFNDLLAFKDTAEQTDDMTLLVLEVD